MFAPNPRTVVDFQIARCFLQRWNVPTLILRQRSAPARGTSPSDCLTSAKIWAA